MGGGCNCIKCQSKNTSGRTSHQALMSKRQYIHQCRLCSLCISLIVIIRGMIIPNITKADNKETYKQYKLNSSCSLKNTLTCSTHSQHYVARQCSGYTDLSEWHSLSLVLNMLALHSISLFDHYQFIL